MRIPLLLAGGVWLCAGCATPNARLLAAQDVARVRTDASSRAGVAELDSAGPSAPGGPGREAAVPLTDASAVRIALAQNPAVVGAYERLGVARARLVQAGLLPNPSVSASATFFSEGPEVELGLVQALLDLATSGCRVAEAADERRATEAEVVSDVVGIVFDVRRALANLRAAERLVAVRREQVEAARASSEVMETLHRAGNVTDDVRTAERIAESRAEVDLSAAQGAREAAHARLAGLLGLRAVDADRPVAPLPDDVPAPPEDASVADRAEAASLALLERRARTSAEARRLGVVVVQRGFPFREAGVVAQRDAEDASWGFGPEFRLELPVFDSGATREAIAEGELRRRMAAYEGERIRVRTAAALLRGRAAELRERARLLRERHLPQRAQLVREVAVRYEAMQVGAFEVLRAKRDEIDARREHVEVLREAWEAHLDLRELMAGRVPDPTSGGERSRETESRDVEEDR